MRRIIILILFVVYYNSYVAQTSTEIKEQIDMSSFGLGIGLDYGGVGINYTTYLQKNIGLFGGIGYSLFEVGFNIGLKGRLISKGNPPTINPFITSMYGKNSFVYIKNATEFNKSFKGISVGGGLDIYFGRKKNGYWTFALLLPVDKSKQENYMDYLKQRYGARFSSNNPPILISIGYKIVVQKKLN
ncbi:MAG: hypothetical protein ACJ04Q_05050 [Flavobacteriales bacterium]